VSPPTATTSLPLPQHQPKWETWPITFAFALRPLRPAPGGGGGGGGSGGGGGGGGGGSPLDNGDKLARIAADARAHLARFAAVDAAAAPGSQV